MLAKINKVDCKTFINHNGWFIQDFMISRIYRRQGYATYFFNLLIEQFYNDCDLLLCADGDGLNFWDKVRFLVWIKKH